MQPKIQKTISAVIGAIGLALLVMMITTEGEPGAIPLALILLSAIGYFTGRMRDEPPRESRRLFGLSHAAIGTV